MVRKQHLAIGIYKMVRSFVRCQYIGTFLTRIVTFYRKVDFSYTTHNLCVLLCWSHQSWLYIIRVKRSVNEKRTVVQKLLVIGQGTKTESQKFKQKNKSMLEVNKTIKWAKKKVEALGVWFTPETNKTKILNYKELMEK